MIFEAVCYKWRNCLMGSLQCAGVNFSEGNMFVCMVKKFRLPVSGGIEQRIDAAALNDSPFIKVGLPVANEVYCFYALLC